MRTVTYSTEALQEAFAEHTVLTLPMVAKALGSSCRMTWSRKLKELDYMRLLPPETTGTISRLELLANKKMDGNLKDVDKL